MKNIIIASREIFGFWKYRGLFAVISGAFILFEMWLANYSLILFVYRHNAFLWYDKISILGSAIKIVMVDFTVGTQLLMYLIALLVGLNFTLLIYYLKQRIALQSAAGTSVFGIALSILGVGCTSCGSVILSSLFGFAVTTKILTILPLRGKEFSLLAIGTLLVSIYLTAQKIVNPLVCKTKI